MLYRPANTHPLQYHANGDSNDPFVHAEFAEIQETIRLEKESSKESWLVLVQTPGNRKRMLLIALTAFFSQCSGNGLVSYYLHDILNSVGITSSYNQSLINGGLQIWSLLVAIGFSVFLVDKFGRKTLFMIAGVGMLVSFSVWTGYAVFALPASTFRSKLIILTFFSCSAVYEKTQNKGAGGAVIGMIFLFYGVAGFAWPGLTVAYCAEILPYNIRAKGLAVNLAIVSLAGVFNQYVNPVGLSDLQWKFYFVYIAILVIECLCIWFLFIETKGPTLEEIAELFDGEDAYVAHIKDHHKVEEKTAEHTEKELAT